MCSAAPSAVTIDHPAADLKVAPGVVRIEDDHRHAGIAGDISKFLVARHAVDDDMLTIGADPGRVNCGEPSGMTVEI